MANSPDLFRTVREFRAWAEAHRRGGGVLGLVPTMGALHEGHRTLMREARKRSTAVAVTIFVNPTQFGPKEDLARYPRDLEGDLAKCAGEGVAAVFAPDALEMYPEGERTRVRVGGLTEHLCGASRPGHFEGVATVVTKLFAVAGPSVAVFGRKDYQQLQVIRRMTRDLLLPVEVVGHPTVREADGLALSSRNAYLSAEERRNALSIPRALAGALARFERGERRVSALRAPILRALSEAGLRPDYVAVADADELVPFEDAAEIGGRALVAVAAFAGTTRLIDNVVLGEDAAPVVTA
jgi:pantoate--beta-alanine ligase